jgi:hypothetical protein
MQASQQKEEKSMEMTGDQCLTAREAHYLMWFVAPFCLALQLNAANVVTDWNVIASTAIVTTGGKSPGASAVWFSYSSLAVYDAVNAITGQYRPFYYHSLQFVPINLPVSLRRCHRLISIPFSHRNAARCYNPLQPHALLPRRPEGSNLEQTQDSNHRVG